MLQLCLWGGGVTHETDEWKMWEGERNIYTVREHLILGLRIVNSFKFYIKVSRLLKNSTTNLEHFQGFKAAVFI